MKRFAVVGLLFLGILLVCPEAALADGYSFTTINVPGAASTNAAGINDKGQIVGTFNEAGGNHGYVDTGGSFTTLDDPSATRGSTVAAGINSSGHAVGAFNESTGPGKCCLGQGFLYDRGSFTTLANPPVPHLLSSLAESMTEARS